MSKKTKHSSLLVTIKPVVYITTEDYHTLIDNSKSRPLKIRSLSNIWFLIWNIFIQGGKQSLHVQIKIEIHLDPHDSHENLLLGIKNLDIFYFVQES